MITKARDPEVWAKTMYFDLKRNWRRLGPLFKSADAERIWRACMWEFYTQEAETHKFPISGDISSRKNPSWYDGCDWRCDRAGREPECWSYACHSACHWVADLAMFVAKSAYPRIPWRILHAQKHTTVWNGSADDPVLFDINFYCIGVETEEAMKLASQGRELKPHKYFKPYLHHSP